MRAHLERRGCAHVAPPHRDAGSSAARRLPDAVRDAQMERRERIGDAAAAGLLPPKHAEIRHRRHEALLQHRGEGHGRPS